MITLLVVGGLAYLAGTLPTAYLLGRWLKRVDIRTLGSGNVGATNAGRVLGWRAGIAVFLVDAGKGALAAWGSPQVHLGEIARVPPEVLQSLAAAAVIAGHVWPVWLLGRGGKGVATSTGAFAVLDPFATLVAAAGCAGAMSLTRYVSVGSLTAAALLPAASVVFGRPLAIQVVSGAVAVLVWYTHLPNMRRLWTGTETRLAHKSS